MDPHLTVTGLSHSHGALHVIEDWHLRVAAGERLVLLGPSGCGKTTFLRIVARLIRPGRGTVETPRGSRVGFVFQEPRLIPWLDVRRNLRFVARGGGARDKAGRGKAAWDGTGQNDAGRETGGPDADELLARLRLTGFERFMPAQLSGGMRQRVNLARALVTSPDLLLLDEALSSLDLKTKVDIMDDIRRLWAACGFTIIAVTHDLKEAISLADRILVLSARPARIRREVPVELGERRDPAAREFLALEARLVEELCGDAPP